jgi:hypothetical protein
MWEYEHSLEADVTPEAVWSLYTAASTWPEWDYGIESMELNGPFAVGTTGTLTPRGQGALPFTLIEVQENAKFVDETNLDGITLHFIHTLEPVAGGKTKITHRVEISGPAAEHVAPKIGSGISEGIPVTVLTLAEQASTLATR